MIFHTCCAPGVMTKMNLITALFCTGNCLKLRYIFNTLFKVTLKFLIFGASFQFYDDIRLKILVTLFGSILP